MLDSQAKTLRAHLSAIEKRLSQLANPTAPAPRPTQAAARAVVDVEACVGCGACEGVCPNDAITVDEVARVDPAKCAACGRCVAECPRGALRLVEAPR